jgi:hypothetical protein
LPRVKIIQVQKGAKMTDNKSEKTDDEYIQEALKKTQSLSEPNKLLKENLDKYKANPSPHNALWLSLAQSGIEAQKILDTSTFMLAARNQVPKPKQADTIEYIKLIKFVFNISNEINVSQILKNDLSILFRYSEVSYHNHLYQAALFYYTLALEFVVREKMRPLFTEQYVISKFGKDALYENLNLAQLLHSHEFNGQVFNNYDKGFKHILKEARNYNSHYFNKELSMDTTITKIKDIQKFLMSLKSEEIE